MSKFVTKKLETVNCGPDKHGKEEWVRIPEAIPFCEAQKFKAMIDADDRNIKMLLEFVKEWNFKDDEGNPVEFNEENLKQLDIRIAALILFRLEDKITIGKKKPENSDKPSGETADVPNTPIT